MCPVVSVDDEDDARNGFLDCEQIYNESTYTFVTDEDIGSNWLYVSDSTRLHNTRKSLREEAELALRELSILELSFLVFVLIMCVVIIGFAMSRFIIWIKKRRAADQESQKHKMVASLLLRLRINDSNTENDGLNRRNVSQRRARLVGKHDSIAGGNSISKVSALRFRRLLSRKLRSSAASTASTAPLGSSTTDSIVSDDNNSAVGSCFTSEEVCDLDGIYRESNEEDKIGLEKHMSSEIEDN